MGKGKGLWLMGKPEEGKQTLVYSPGPPGLSAGPATGPGS